MSGKTWMKRTLALLCIGMLSCSMIGCGKSEGGGKEQTPVDNQTDSSQEEREQEQESELPLSELTLPLSEETVELSVWMDNWQSSLVNSPDELPSYQELERRTNVHINWTFITSTEAQEKFGLLIASDNIPDIVRDVNYYYPGGVEKSVEEGLFIEVNDLVEQYMPNYRALLATNPEVEKAVKTDSGKYVIFNLNGDDESVKLENDYVGPIIRKDWLDELGLKTPVTLDDWHTVLTAFKKEKDCEAPLMLGPYGYLTQSGAFLSAFGVLQEFYVEDGTVKFGPMEEGYRSYIELMRQWFSEGLIDQNFTANAALFMAPTDYLATGRCGAADCIPNYCSNQLAVMGYTDNMDLNFEGVAYPVLNEGDTPLSGYSLSKYADNSYGISASCKNPEIAAMWLDYQYSDDGMALNNYGIEGDSYTKDSEGNYHLTDVILNNPDYVPSQAHTLYCNYSFGRYNWDRQKEANSSYEVTRSSQQIWLNADHSKVYPQYTSLTAEEGVEYSSKYTAVSTLVQEKTVKYIMGTESMDTYDQFLADLKNYGIEDCIKIKQAAYERYMAR